jgi:MFS family permease
MPSFIESFGELSPSVHGLVISSILLTGTFTSLFGGAISDSIGRTRTIAIGSLIFAVGTALETGAVTLVMFIIARCLAGLGEGVLLSALIV